MSKKILFIIFIIVICTGCNVKYSLTINKDNTIEESIYASEDYSFFENYPHSSVGRVISFLIEPYLDKLNSNEYSVETNVKSKSGGVSISKTFDSIEEYSKNTLFYNQYTDKIDCNVDGNIVTLTVKGKFVGETQNQSKFPVSSAEIKINVPFKVLESNADIVDGNEYIWNVDKTEREIKIVYDKSKENKKSDYTSIIIICAIIAITIISLIIFMKINSKKEFVNKV